MITVRINKETALEMLVDRVAYWTEDNDVIDLFSQMYENYIWGGCFDGSEFDVNKIVDNDYINNCSVLFKGDQGYGDINSLFDENGCGDISCEYDRNGGWSFIEAERNGMFLLRY